MKYLEIEDISAYRTAFELSNFIWKVAIKLPYFARDTIGKQFVNAVDSISANISEGFGRYSRSDKIRFYRISYGSVLESVSWTKKAKNRNLLTDSEYCHIKEKLDLLPKDIYSLINYTNRKLLQ